VRVDGEPIAAIGAGLVILAGVESGDELADVQYLADKIAHLRILPDADGKMNVSLAESGAEALLVSQFTLLADTRKGRRPSFTRAAPPELAESLIAQLAAQLHATGVRVRTGRFGASMDVALVNHGPVTIVIDSVERTIPRRQV